MEDKQQQQSPLQININPATPGVVSFEPDFSPLTESNVSSYSMSSDKSMEASSNNDTKDSKPRFSPFQGRHFFLSQKKSSSSSFHTSLDYTDDESVATGDGDQSNGSLSDSMNQSTFREKLKNFSTKDKKRKKQNRISKIISGVSYKSKAELVQKLFKDMSVDEQLIVDYSCALYRDILVHGRLYLSQNWLCFYANIFGWETLVTIQWTEITAITKEKTAKVIPNAIQILTESEKYFFSTFVTRENAYTALFRIWQNALLGLPMNPAELKAVCKKYRQKKSAFQDTIDGDPVHDDHDETGDEILEEDDTRSIISTSESIENLTSRTETSIVTENSPEPTDQTGHENQIQSYTNGNYVGDQGIGNRSSSGSSNKVKVSGEDTSKSNGEDESKTNGDHTNKPIQKEPHATNFDLKVDMKPRTESKNSQNSNGYHKEDQKSHLGSALKNLHNFHRPTSPFSKANDFFRKKKKKKVQRSKYPSYHLSTPSHEGETTSEFDSDDSGADAADEDDNDVFCPCHDNHFGKCYADEELNFDVDALYEHLFSQESDMMKRVFEQRNFYNWRYTPYEKATDNNYTQTLQYTLPLNYSIGPKESDTTSKQIMHSGNKPGLSVVVDVENTSQGVPYSDSFLVCIRYCMTRLAGNRSRLIVHGELRYTKRVFGLVKNMISKTSEEACRDYFTYLAGILKSESELIPPSIKVNSKKNKPSKKGKDSSKATKDQENKPQKVSTTPRLQEITTSSTASTGFLSSFQPSTATVGAFFIFILLLLGMNLYLMGRLKNLESSVLVTKNAWLPKELPSSKEEWVKLLDYQKSLHDLELLKLKEVIGNTAHLVKQVEISISGLHDELEKNVQKQIESDDHSEATKEKIGL